MTAPVPDPLRDLAMKLCEALETELYAYPSLGLRQAYRALRAALAAPEPSHEDVANAIDPKPSTALALIPQAEVAVRNEATRRANVTRGLDLAATVVFTYWRDSMGFHPARTILSPKRKERIVARLRENGGDVSELLYVVDGALRDDWTMGRDPRSTKAYNGTETVFRDREKVESFLALVKHQETEHPFLRDHP